MRPLVNVIQIYLFMGSKPDLITIDIRDEILRIIEIKTKEISLMLNSRRINYHLVKDQVDIIGYLFERMKCIPNINRLTISEEN